MGPLLANPRQPDVLSEANDVQDEIHKVENDLVCGQHTSIKETASKTNFLTDLMLQNSSRRNIGENLYQAVDGDNGLEDPPFVQSPRIEQAQSHVDK